jgi:hypothetical protein
MYAPTLRALPSIFNNRPYDDEAWKKRIKDQERTSACTGFALSSMVEHLRLQAKQPEKEVSAHMLYFMARLYDELPGEDSLVGSTIRGAMKAWHKHGACEEKFWDKTVDDPNEAVAGWQNDAFKTPLGAYFRVDHTSITDMHAAISETGVIFASALANPGWYKTDANGNIPEPTFGQEKSGHAFLIVGYDEKGFWIQNSWGKTWGKNGFGHLSYSQWNEFGFDAWIGQLGVNISRFADTVASGMDLTKYDPTQPACLSLLSTNPQISAQQINHYIVNLENNGRLSSNGQFYTRLDDLRLLVTKHLEDAIAQWGLTKDDPINIALYAHGGLTPESGAANTARSWIPELFANKIFPVFFMWETGLLDTLYNIAEDRLKGTAGPAERFFDNALDWMDQRVEGLLSKPGTVVWDQMKQNAYAATENEQGGLALLGAAFEQLVSPDIKRRMRLHLIGHSAGSEFHAHLLPRLIELGLEVDGIYFMAPACTVKVFKEKILPQYEAGRVQAFTQFHLYDEVEKDDNCHPLPYNKSLLYLVSNSFERKRETPILGLQDFAKGFSEKPKRAKVWDFIHAPTSLDSSIPITNRSLSTTHGGFDNDKKTRDAIIARIKSRIPTLAVKASSAKEEPDAPPQPVKK